MRSTKRLLAACLALLMMLTPAMEVYATNAASVPVNTPVVLETEDEEPVDESQMQVDESNESADEATGSESDESIDNVTDIETDENVDGETGLDTEDDLNESDENSGEEATNEEAADGESKAEVEETTEENVTEESTEEVETETDTVSENEIGLASIDLFSMSQEERLEFLESRNPDLARWAEETGRVPNGHIDVDYEVEMPDDAVYGDDYIHFVKGNTSIPISYDARDKGHVSSVKEQYPWETCWAFATVSIAEGAYMKAGNSEINMSESHLVDFFYNEENLNYSGLSGDYTYPLQHPNETTSKYATEAMRGGNNLFTTWGLARWNGIAKEDASLDGDLVYSTAVSNDESGKIDIDDSLAFTDVMHLENAYWLSFDDKDSVKTAIMEYGAVGMDYYYSEWYDSDTYKENGGSDYSGPAVYYNPYDEDANHSVSIVGWNDSFKRENFAYTYLNQYLDYCYESMELPKKDGAWLVKNSWGTEVGDSGYFWISYEDLAVQNSVAFVFDFALADNYDHNYQYDGSSGIYAYGGGKSITAAAVYKADMGANLQTVEAVGVGFASPGNSYTVSIYGDLEDPQKPDSGELLTTQTGTSSYEGFYTIKLDEPAVVEKDELFSVVIEVKNNKGAAIFVDMSYDDIGWIKFVAQTNPGETFVKSGSSWEDAATSNEMTMRIKAFVNDAADIVVDKILTDNMITAIPTQTYMENGVEPAVKVSYEGTELKLGTDYTVVYNNNTAVGTATATITGKGDYSGSVTKEFTILPKTITADMVTVDKVAFTGVKQNPVVVMNGDVTMMSDDDVASETADYTITYNKEPINAGTYQATITGINNYTGSVKATVKIDKTDIATTDVALSTTSATYNMTAQKPDVTVKIGSTLIDAKSNYSVKYTANTNAGTATVTVTGKGSLSGKTTKTFTISPKSIASEGITVTVAKAAYSGSALTPKVTVKDGTKTLSLNKDYTLEYADNVDASEAAKVSVIGKGNYSGTKQQTFEITAKAISASSIKADLLYEEGKTTPAISVNAYSGKIVFNSDDFTYEIKEVGKDVVIGSSDVEVGTKYDVVITLKGNYTGSNTVKKVPCKVNFASETYELALVKPDAEYVYNGKAHKPAVVVTHNAETVPTKDYTVTYTNNVNAGEATVTVTGKNAIAGTISKTFTIEPKNVTPETLYIAPIKAVTYTGKALTPAVTVKDGKNSLKVNKDYTLTHSDNINVTERAKVAITLSDNYTFDEKTGMKIVTNFTILPAKISSVKATPQWFKGDGEEMKTTLTVQAGKLVLAESDYDVTYENHKAVGTAKVTVTAKDGSNYTGEKSATYKISKENISKATVEGVTDLTYTGKTLEQTSVVVKNQEGEVIPASDYTVTYKNNTKAGKATLTIKANADSIYTGSKNISFVIKPADLDDILVVQDDVLYAKNYDGKKQTYTTKELQNAFKESTTGALIPTSAYKVTYSNNIDAGQATMILTGKGNYTGTKEIKFTIAPKNIKELDIYIKGVAEYQEDGGIAVPDIKYFKDGKYNLVQGKDYTFSCSGAKARGVARITITGTGNYTGSRSFYYTVR